MKWGVHSEAIYKDPGNQFQVIVGLAYKKYSFPQNMSHPEICFK
jgi:hypothetical protein